MSDFEARPKSSLTHDYSLEQFEGLEDEPMEPPFWLNEGQPSGRATAKKSTAPDQPVTKGPGPRQQMALDFLAMLGRNTFEFRCFTDDKSATKKGMQREVGDFIQAARVLKQLNDQGYGVFVQIAASDGKGNTTKNIVSAPCHFVDLDGSPLANVDRVGIPPTAVYETSPGKWHAYWTMDGIALSEFKAVQQRLAALCESDMAVNDLARVMRLPGFFHMKNPIEPFLVSHVGGSGSSVSRKAFMDALAAAENERGLNRKGARRETAKEQHDVSDLRRAEAAIRFLVDSGEVQIADYAEWRNLGFALRQSFGEDGWTLFHALSAEDDNYEDEESCRAFWDGIKEPSSGKPITIATYFHKAQEAGLKGLSLGRARSSEESGEGSDRRSSKDHAVEVLRQAQEAGDELFLDQRGIPHVHFNRLVEESQNAWVTTPVTHDVYSGVLRLRFFLKAETKTLPSEALKSAVEIFKAQAGQAGIKRRVEFRVGGFNGDIYVDLGRQDGKQVRIHADGYEVVDKSPVRFALSGRGELPLPSDGAKLVDLTRHLSNLSSSDAQRVLGYLISAFNPDGTYALLSISAGPGHGKSFLADKVMALIDPPQDRAQGRLSVPRKEDDLIAQGSAAHVLLFDNVSSLTAEQADNLCKVTSGAGLTKRALFTDNTAYTTSIRRPVIMTSIGSPSDRGDLLDRTLVISPNPIGRQLPEAELWAQFEQDRPKLLGLIFRGVSAALRNKQRIAELEEAGVVKLPRLADLARFAEGAHELLGLEPGAFSNMLRDGQDSLKGEAAAGDPLGTAIIRSLSNHPLQPIQGTAAEIRDILSCGPEEEKRDLPKVNKLRPALIRIEAGLRDLGIMVSMSPPRGKANVWRMQICATENFVPTRAGQGGGL